MLALLLNLRMSIRSLRKSPGFTLTALLTIALGIGAITSVFSVVNTVLLKPFAFHDPGQLTVGNSVATERFQALGLTSFGATALLLALLGVCGVLVYSVSLRNRSSAFA